MSKQVQAAMTKSNDAESPDLQRDYASATVRELLWRREVQKLEMYQRCGGGRRVLRKRIGNA